MLYYRMKCMASHGSVDGRPGAGVALVVLRSHAMLRARVRMVCRPSVSSAASPSVRP